MKLKNFIFYLSSASLLLVSGCVENVKENSKQSIHLYTDLSNSLDSTLFDNFEKRTNIHVYVHHSSSIEILQKLKTEKWESNMDAVLLSNALDLIELNEENLFSKTAGIAGNDDFNWQALFSNPFVFTFPKDSVNLFKSYGQLFRNDNSRVGTAQIKSFDRWGNLIPALKKNYLIYSLSQIQGQILYSDTLNGTNIKYVEIAPYSFHKNKSKIVFPDQFYKGSVGIIGGIGLIKQSKNRANASILFEHCRNITWRKKLAQVIDLFPILSPEENKSRQILLYQTPTSLRGIKNNAN